MKDNLTRIPIVYCRVSSERQKRDGGGLESQEQRCRAYCTTHNYGEPVRVFKDSFTGGGDFMERPAMRELFEFLDANLHNNYVIVFDDLKRLARDTTFHLKLRREFSARGATVECPNFTFEDTPEGYFIETILAAQGELERKQNARQVIQKQKARLERGYWAFHAPKGYSMKKTDEGNKCFPNESGAILREGLEGFAYKRFVKTIELAKFLQEKGFFNQKPRPERYLETTKSLLLNPFYAGFIEYLDWDVKRFKGKHEALISEEVFEANNKRIHGEGKGGFVRQDVREDFPLRGLVNCYKCEKKMTAYFSRSKTGVYYPYYSCQRLGCSLRSRTIDRELIHQGFKAIVTEQKPKPDLISIVAQMFDEVWEEEMKGVGKNANQMTLTKIKLEEEIGKLADEAIDIDNPIVKRQYQKRIEEKSIQVEEIEVFLGKQIKYDVPYRTSYEKITGLIKNPYEIWEKGTVKQKQELFHFFFDDRITYVYEKGYRTPEKSCLYKLFDRIEAGHTVDVEMARIEPASESECNCESTVRSSSFDLSS
jgi:site-specific DNA recombinase